MRTSIKTHHHPFIDRIVSNHEHRACSCHAQLGGIARTDAASLGYSAVNHHPHVDAVAVGTVTAHPLTLIATTLMTSGARHSSPD